MGAIPESIALYEKVLRHGCPYFYRTAEAELEGRGQLIAIYNRFIYDDFRERLLFSDKSASKYMEQIPNEEIAIIWALMFVEWGLCEKDEDYTINDYYAENQSDYYHDNMREELLETYLFCKQTPIRPRRTNEIILTINKGYKGYSKNSPCRISKTGYYAVHCCNIARAIWKTYTRWRRHKRHWMPTMKKRA